MLVTGPGRSLRLATAALRGHLPADADWPAVLDTANRGWLGPALYLALGQAGRLDEVPEPVHEYLAFLHDRNRERNQRLRAQLVEAIGVLNGQGIRPVLLKGAIHLFAAPDERLGARMMSDLDISIAPSETAAARAALEVLGYQDLASTRGMVRPQDVGSIELHDRPSSRSTRYLSHDLRRSSPTVEKDGMVVHVPSPTARALHLIVHDMIKEGDYWRLGVDLRHLHDLAELAGSGEGVDWHQVHAVMSDRDGRGALAVQALALRDLFGIAVPSELCGGGMAGLRHLGRLIAGTRGLNGALARTIGRLTWGADRFAKSYTWHGGWDLSRRVYRVLTAPTKGSRL